MPREMGHAGPGTLARISHTSLARHGKANLSLSRDGKAHLSLSRDGESRLWSLLCLLSFFLSSSPFLSSSSDRGDVGLSFPTSPMAYHTIEISLN
jgi:hypothetical protein